jgi:calcineurin-like phosphoesterase family protein
VKTFKASEVFFTSDIHFFHDNIIKYCNRPWANVNDMTAGIIENWNNKVPNDDCHVFIVGDLAMGGIRRASELASCLSKMKGVKHLVPGNHDTYLFKSDECMSQLVIQQPLTEIYIEDDGARHGRQSIILCHYAMKIWNNSHKGSWHLFGHSHHTMPPDLTRKAFDVGIDGSGYGYAPLSYFDVKNIMKNHNNENVDHHSKETN